MHFHLLHIIYCIYNAAASKAILSIKKRGLGLDLQFLMYLTNESSLLSLLKIHGPIFCLCLENIKGQMKCFIFEKPEIKYLYF